MKLVKIKVKGIPLFKDTLEVDFFAQQRVNADDSEMLQELFSYKNSSIYLNNAIGLIGINASGKTTTLKVIAFVIEMLNHKPINSIPTNKIMSKLDLNETVIFETYFYCEDETINKLETKVKKCPDEKNCGEKYIIVEERAWSKPVASIKSKEDMFNFQKRNISLERNNDAEFLLDDVSISISIMKRANAKEMFFWDMLNLTDYTILRVKGNFPMELVEFLDPSIEWIKCEDKGIDSERAEKIHLKFKGKEEIILRNILDLQDYLSSGTIKGLSIFMNAIFTFQSSGYLIVDELENHFNKEIVATLIRFFMDSKVNSGGGTLIFSTHYPELLDEFKRNDCIYIIKNKEGITAENLSRILKRNDIKKSEAYESGYLEGTVPIYDSYMKLKKSLYK